MDHGNLVNVNKLIPFWEKSISDLDSAKKYAELLLKSKAVSPSYYDSPEEVLYAMQYGYELGLPISQALQVLIPSNGKMTILGDGAKALIFKSGLVGSWVENEIENGYEIKVTRSDNGVSITRRFDINDAKIANLYISEEEARKSKFLRNNPWYTHFLRMCYYRALGYIARDLFADVLKAVSLFEEVSDYSNNRSITIDLDNGKELKTDVKESIRESESITNQAKEASESRERAIESVAGEKEELSSQKIEVGHVYGNLDKMTEREIQNMGSPLKGKLFDLLEGTIYEYLSDNLPGKKTNMKVRKLITEDQQGNLRDYILEKYSEDEIGLLDNYQEPIKENLLDGEEDHVEVVQDGNDIIEKSTLEDTQDIEAGEKSIDDLPDHKRDKAYIESIGKEEEEEEEEEKPEEVEPKEVKVVTREKAPDDSPFDEVQTITYEKKEPENKPEPVEKEDVHADSETNPFHLDIPEIEKGEDERDPFEVLDMMEALESLSPALDDNTYERLIRGLEIGDKYPELQLLLEKGSVKEINSVLIEHYEENVN